MGQAGLKCSEDGQLLIHNGCPEMELRGYGPN